jgi:hypothetical protein
LHTRRCQELFAELDRSGAGVLDRRELTSMVLRMLPEVRRAEVRYFRAMLDAGDVAGGVAFDAFVSMVRECAAAAGSARDGGARWEGIAATLRQCMDDDGARMVQACGEFDIDHRCDVTTDESPGALVCPTHFPFACPGLLPISHPARHHRVPKQEA